MEIQVQELLERIRNEGIESAKKQADEILAEARARAEDIVTKASHDADNLLADAQQRIRALEAASKESLLQASRDTMIALRQSVQKFFEAALRTDINAALDSNVLAQVIPDILKALSTTEKAGDFEVLLPPAVLASLDKGLASRLAKDIGKGVEFKPYPSIDAGFRVAVGGSAAHYDFSADVIAQVLSARVNRILAEYLKEAAGSIA